jgi:hypothetical protein
VCRVIVTARQQFADVNHISIAERVLREFLPKDFHMKKKPSPQNLAKRHIC